jgi:ABC-type nickel/cobalt efflux system permease component RcnA
VFGLDDRLAHLTGGSGGLGVALAVALLLGLRHATDPDHLTAVSTLTLGQREAGARRAGALGAAWGIGHATTLLLCGLPVVLLRRNLPEPIQHAAELAVGAIIVALAARLLVRWRRGYFHVHEHEHDGVRHVHPHAHEHSRSHSHPLHHEHRHGLGRSPLAAFGIGLVHGLGGSAGVALLLVGAMPGRGRAAVALVVFASATALSMTAISATLGRLVSTERVARHLSRAIPTLATATLLFGLGYAVAAMP